MTGIKKEKTETLTITIDNIPSELVDLIWKGVNKTAKNKSFPSIEKLTHIKFDCDNTEGDLILKLVGSSISTHCALLTSK